MYKSEGLTTLTIDEHSACTPEDNVCVAFDFIACSVLEQTYYDPMVREYALDGCYTLETGCGDEAADAFCQDEGYSEATEYSLVEAEEETMYIGNYVICNPSHHECNTFLYITCFTPSGSTVNMSQRQIQRESTARMFANGFN